MHWYHYREVNYRRKVLLKACVDVSLAAIQIAQSEVDEVCVPKKRRKPRSCWTRQWLANRPRFGQYEQLMTELRETDPDGFKAFQRLTPELWNEVYEKVAPRIERQTTVMREPISAGHRLAITLRFLATGDSYMTQMFGFRVADNTVSGIVPDTCNALYEVLADEYFQVKQMFNT